MCLSHFRELFDFNLWANQRLYGIAEALDDAALDREFPIGHGSLRKNLNHIYAVDRIWYERIDGLGFDEARPAEALTAVADMRASHERLHAVRDDWLSTLPADAPARPISYRNMRGEPFTNT